MYFALPTRVAARELFSRVQRAMERAFPSPDARPSPILLAAPGYVRVAVAERALPAPDGRLWEDDPVERLRERVWAAAHPKRFLTAPIAVGTIDQALLSGLRVKHSMMRSVCLDRSLLVVDEVHASDPYMRELLAAVLARHRARGGHALLLSATLGDIAGAQYFRRSLFTLHESASRPYPSITTLAGEAPIDRTPSAKTVDVEVVDSFDNEAIVPRIVRALRDGARVLAICNTVARANALLRAVEANAETPKSALFAVNGSVCPHHGRFARDHREVMDAAVTARLGKGTLDGPVLLVGTQTLEQSLDIDADWLVTDLCPMDVLLQRIGRLHRHVRPTRPREFTTARVLLRGPPGGDLAPSLVADGALRAPAGLGIVYPDGRVLQRTLDLVRERARLTLPHDNRELVEQTTHPDALATLPASWMRHGREFVEGREMAQVRAAVANSLDDQVPFGELAYPAPDESIGTRLGAATIELPLREPVDRVFGVAAHAIGLAAHLLPRGVVLPEALEPAQLDDGFVFSLGPRRFRYTRYGLEVDDDA
jgi:CRISPR-associated endonuclease/helicase Cas3